MKDINTARKILNTFKGANGIDTDVENIAPVMHVMSQHRVDKNTALDQSSLGSHDNGIDSWIFSPDFHKLFIYQSKLTQDTAQAIKGLKDIERALDWVEGLICDKTRDSKKMNTALSNLVVEIGNRGLDIREVEFCLLSFVPGDKIQSSKEWDSLQKKIEKSRLHQLMVSRKGSVELFECQPSLQKRVALVNKKYSVQTFKETQLEIRKGVYLKLSYVPLLTLVRLYQSRGPNLFEKNVRMSLLTYKDSANRVAHPMEDTLDQIASGHLPPEIFAFYHVGITLWTGHEEVIGSDGELALEDPAVINGCQTITIAEKFLRELTARKDLSPKEITKRVAKLEAVKVVAKIVVGSSDEELRDITNSNNRQNPIENWQLYSNEPIHHEIESSLAEEGIFYERQKGRFASMKEEGDILFEYENTNDTSISIPNLATAVALCRGELELAAKNSDIFMNRVNHDAIFNSLIVSNSSSIVLIINLLKAVQRAVNNVARDAEFEVSLLRAPQARVHLWRLGVLSALQMSDLKDRDKYSKTLFKSAIKNLVTEVSPMVEKIMRKAVAEIKKSNKSTGREITKAVREKIFKDIATNNRINLKEHPFNSSKARV